MNMSLVDGLLTIALLLLIASLLFLLFCLFLSFSFSLFTLLLSITFAYHESFYVDVSTLESGRAFDTRCQCGDPCFYVAVE
jgi:hypothetical protein